MMTCNVLLNHNIIMYKMEIATTFVSVNMPKCTSNVATLNGGVTIDGENGTGAEVTPATPNMASTTSSTA